MEETIQNYYNVLDLPKEDGWGKPMGRSRKLKIFEVCI